MCAPCTLTLTQVIKEERRLARDKAAYARIRQAYASTVKRPAPAGLLGGLEANGGVAGAARRAAAGAIAAAARELRPVELVGIYEGQKEALERELAAAKAEVRKVPAFLRLCAGVQLDVQQLYAFWHLGLDNRQCATASKPSQATAQFLGFISATTPPTCRFCCCANHTLAGATAAVCCHTGFACLCHHLTGHYAPLWLAVDCSVLTYTPSFAVCLVLATNCRCECWLASCAMHRTY